jgi:NADH-quinone oxidoreductase subunit F
VQRRFQELLGPEDAGVTLKETGCIGLCHREVLVEIVEDGRRRTLYGEMAPDRVDRIVADHLRGGRVVEEWVVDREGLLAGQKRIVLRNCGEIAPSSIEEYRARGGYLALSQAVTAMTPGEVIEAVADSGLRGRGGAGFPTGTKWRLAQAAKAERKFIICNADEGDPGAFMDRSVLESDPHSVLEGMAIAGYAIGAGEGIVYVRAEYPLAIRRLREAVASAREMGLLGPNLFDSGFSFSIRLKEGAGAFVCGEETALIASIEGRRGMPRVRPPFPTEAGLWGFPTCINNVETFANVPWILTHGAGAFRSCGTGNSKGTKVFALAGKIRGGSGGSHGHHHRRGRLRIGGGTVSGAIQGGPDGGRRADASPPPGRTPIDYDSLTATGAIMGSGGMVVMDESTCMVDVARYFLSFTQSESCGKCTFCRMGTKRMPRSWRGSAREAGSPKT